MSRNRMGIAIVPLLIFSHAASARTLGDSEPAVVEGASFEPSAVAAPDTTMVITAPPTLPRRARVADPWFTRGSVTMAGGLTAWDAVMPVPGMAEKVNASAPTGGFDVDLYGRQIAFHLSFAGLASNQASAPVEGIDNASLTSGEVRANLSAALWNSHGVFVGAGPGIEGRITTIGTLETGDEAFSSWQTVVAGADVRMRVFLGPRLFLTGTVFYGLMPLQGSWQTVNAAPPSGDQSDWLQEGSITKSAVLSTSIGASLRPAEWIALHGGVAIRSATHELDVGETGKESGLRPFLGLELLY